LILSYYPASKADANHVDWVSSGLRSLATLTCVVDSRAPHSYPVLKKRLGDKVTLLTELQEVNDHPCDTGSSREDLEANPEFAGLDFSPLSDAPATHGVAWTSKKGIYDPKNVLERAKWVRKWLRNREETVIVGESRLRRASEGRRTASGADLLR
jgi:hypothetical protein